jgi:hypothetical protein
MILILTGIIPFNWIFVLVGLVLPVVEGGLNGTINAIEKANAELEQGL